MISQINSADTPDHEQNTPRGESIERGEAIEHPAANTGDTTTRRHASDSDTVLEEMTLRHLADSPPSADAEEGVVATDTASDGDIEGGTAQKMDMGDPDDFMNEKRHEVSATTSHHGRRNKKSGSKRRSKSKSKSKSHREDKTPQRDHSARVREKTKQTNAAIATSHIESRGSTSTTSHQNPSTEGKRGIDSLPSGDDDEAGAAIRIPDNRSFSSPADNDNNDDNDDNNNPSLCLLFDEEAQSNDDDDIAASSTHPSEGLDISENDYMDNTISDRALMNIIATDSGAVGAFHIDEPVPNIDDNMGTVEDRMRSTTVLRREGLASTRSMVSERREDMMNASARFLRIDSSDDESRRKLKRRMCMLTLLFVGTFAVVGGVTSGIRALMLDPPPDETIVIELNFDETSSGDGAEAEDESSSPATVTRPLTDFEIVTGMVDGRPLTNAEIAKGEVEMEAVDPYELFP